MNKFLLVIILLSGSSLFYGCSADVTDAQRLANAQEYLDAGEMKAASIELKNVLQDDPDNPQARLLMGRLHLEMGNMAASEKELTRASELGVGDELILPLMAQALLLQGKTAEVQRLPLQNLTAAGQAEVLAAQGRVKLSQGEVTEAALLTDQAISKDPASINALIASVRVHAENKEIDLAREKLKAASLIDQKSVSTWSMLGDIEWQEQNLDLAEEAYGKAIEFGTNNFSDHYKRALVRIQLKKYNEAQKDIDAIKRGFPQHAGANYAQGVIDYQNKNFRDAAPSFEIALSDESRFPLALFYLGASYFHLNNIEQAETYANRFVYVAPDNIDGRRLLAMVMYKKGNYSKAEELIQPVTEARKDDTAALNLLSSSLIKQGKMNEAIDLLDKLATLEPDSTVAQARLGAGLLLLTEGEQKSGVEHLETALQLKPDNQQANVLLVLNYLQQKNYDEALKAANTFREQSPESAVPYNMLGKVYLATGQEKDAQEAFLKAGGIAPGNPYAYLNLASLALKNKDYDKARDYHQEILKYHDNYLPSLMGLAIIDGLTKDEKSMVERLQQAIKAHPKAVKPRLVLARYYLARGKPDKAAFLVSELDAIQKKSPAVLKLIAMTHLAKSEYLEAKITLEKLITLQPEHADAHQLLAKAYAGLKDRQRTKAELQKTVELAPDNLPVRLTLARLLLLEKNKAGVREQLGALKELAPDNPEVLMIEASMASLDGDPQEAYRLTEKAFEKSPTTTIMLILANQKKGMGDLQGAQRLQQAWVKKYPGDTIARTALANFYAASNQKDKAIEQYSRVLEINGNNLAALNNLAWYLRDTNPQQALEYAKRANEINPGSASFLDTLAVVLLKNGEIQKAQRAIARAVAGAPNNPTMRYHSAMINASAGDKASAIKTLRALLVEGVEFPEREQAIKLLAQLES